MTALKPIGHPPSSAALAPKPTCMMTFISGLLLAYFALLVVVMINAFLAPPNTKTLGSFKAEDGSTGI